MYPEGFAYFNEFAQSIIWEPVAFSYALLISGADLLLLSAIAYLSGYLRRAIPMFIVLGLSFFSVILLGPLADLSLPNRAALIMIQPHVISDLLHPGISVMALYGGVLWSITFIIAIIFSLLYFSYPMHEKGGFFSFLSLGIRSKERYENLKPVMRILAAILILFASLWTIYPGMLFYNQTWIYAWRNWDLMLPMFLAETFLTATGSALIFYYLVKIKDEKIRRPLLQIHGAAAITLAGILVLQILIWQIRYDNPNFSAVVPIMQIASVIFVLTFILALISAKYSAINLGVPIIALFGVVLNKWNLIINGQLISRSGLAVLEPHLAENWLAETIAPIALAIFILIILSSIFPIEVKEDEA